MLTKPQPPRLSLPKGWQDGVKSLQMFHHTIWERRLPLVYWVGGLPLLIIRICWGVHLSRLQRRLMLHSSRMNGLSRRLIYWICLWCRSWRLLNKDHPC